MTPCAPQHREMAGIPAESRRAGSGGPLRNEFDELFSTVTGYDELDQRVARTRADKTYLLMEALKVVHANATGKLRACATSGSQATVKPAGS